MYCRASEEEENILLGLSFCLYPSAPQVGYWSVCSPFITHLVTALFRAPTYNPTLSTFPPLIVQPLFLYPFPC